MTDKRAEITQAETFRLIFESRALLVRTTIPAQVVAFNSERNSVDVQPVLQTVLDGETEPRNAPIINDVPIEYYGANNFWITIEPKEGDYCVLSVSDRCIEGWKKAGGIIDPKLNRHHDASDAFAYFGVNPFPDAIPSIEADTLHIRSKDGATGVRVKADSVECYTGDSSHLVEAAKISNTVGGVLVSESTSGLVDFKVPIKAPSSTVAGLTTTGTLTVGGQSFSSHTHSGVTTGTGNTGGVN